MSQCLVKIRDKHKSSDTSEFWLKVIDFAYDFSGVTPTSNMKSTVITSN